MSNEKTINLDTVVISEARVSQGSVTCVLTFDISEQEGGDLAEFLTLCGTENETSIMIPGSTP